MKARHREPLRINFASRKNGLARSGQAAENGRNVINLRQRTAPVCNAQK